MKQAGTKGAFTTKRLELTRDAKGTPISSTTSRIMLSNISWETFWLISSDSVKSLAYWWDVIPISWGCQPSESVPLCPDFLQKTNFASHVLWNRPHLSKRGKRFSHYKTQYLWMTSWENKVSRKFPNITTPSQHNYFIVRCLHYCTITQWAWSVLTTNTVVYRKIEARNAQKIWIASISIKKSCFYQVTQFDLTVTYHESS